MKKILFVFVMFVMYITTSEMSAKKKAEGFCDSVKIGDQTAEIRENAISGGARGKDSNWNNIGGATRQIDLTYTGYYRGSDFICRITEKNGVVFSKNHNIISSLL